MTYVGLQQFIDTRPDLLTVGLRAAYANGLEVAVPVAVDTLGWAMAEPLPVP